MKSARHERPRIVLLVGSAPDAVRCAGWPKSAFDKIVVINNAWRVRPDWDFLVHAGDFPSDRMPDDHTLRAAQIYSADEYVPAQNAFGGFVYAGGTMAYTAAYWVLHSQKPDIIAFLGCDMIYASGGEKTHFYGIGRADPLRPDITLQSLEAKAARLMFHAIGNDCLCCNLSELPQSRLVFPRVSLSQLTGRSTDRADTLKAQIRASIDPERADEARRMEAQLNYYFEDGRYWKHFDKIDGDKLSTLDRIWLSSMGLN